MTNVLTICASLLLAVPPDPCPSLIVVIGAPGSEEYGEQFHQWGQRWQQAAQCAGARVSVIGLNGATDQADRDVLKNQIAAEQNVPAAEALWIVLIGHGTFDGHAAKFNLRGPDISAEELAGWLQPSNRPLVIINCASSSAPFINQLSGPNRIVVTATKSGYQYNFARFGGYLAKAIMDPSADLDKDEQISLLEAFLSGAAHTAEFYDQEARLATEHALLDDNGDGLGTPASWYRGVRATGTAKGGATPDGQKAHQLCLIRGKRQRAMSPEMRARRDELHREVDQLRGTKQNLQEEEYYRRIESLLVELALLYEQAEKQSPPSTIE